MVFFFFFRISRTRTSIGTRPASSATSVESPWWINNSVARSTRFTVATVMMLSLQADAMDVARSSVPVREYLLYLLLSYILTNILTYKCMKEIIYLNLYMNKCVCLCRGYMVNIYVFYSTTN